MTIPDVLSAVRAVLRADAAVTAAVPAGQIYAGEMPQTETVLQPRTAVVLALAGGPADRGYVQLGRRRMDVRCYGATPFEAMKLANQVYESLKGLQRRRVASVAPLTTPTLIHGINIEAGPTPLRDADGDWPMTFFTVEVVAAEVAA